jgi:hypothetical protein
MADSEKKLPVGLEPKWSHNLSRMVDVLESIVRYVKVHEPIPEEWFEEALELLKAARARQAEKNGLNGLPPRRTFPDALPPRRTFPDALLPRRAFSDPDLEIAANGHISKSDVEAATRDSAGQAAASAGDALRRAAVVFENSEKVRRARQAEQEQRVRKGRA